jgi:hypothetical protein
VWKNIAVSDRPQVAILYRSCVLLAGYLRLQIHTHWLCNIHCFSTAVMVALTHLNVRNVIRTLPVLLINTPFSYSYILYRITLTHILFHVV